MVDRAGGQFDQFFIDGDPVIANQANAVGIDQRQNDRRPRMHNGLARMNCAVGKLSRLANHAKAGGFQQDFRFVSHDFGSIGV